MGEVILIFVCAVLTFSIFVMTVVWINDKATDKVKRSIDDVSALLKDSQYSLIIFEARSEEEFTYFGIVTDEDLKSAGIKKNNGHYSTVTVRSNSILAEGMTPRKFLTLLRQVKRGTVSLDQVYKMTMVENDKYFKKLKASKTI